mgnify:CR=1 FL=1
MHRTQVITLGLAVVLMAGCSNMKPQYTKDDYKAANKYCLDQSNSDKKASPDGKNECNLLISVDNFRLNCFLIL